MFAALAGDVYLNRKKTVPYFYTYSFSNNSTTTQQLPLHLKYALCHTFIYTITTARLACNTLKPYCTIISLTQFPSYQHGRLQADGAIPGDVIDHDSRLKVGVNLLNQSDVGVIEQKNSTV